VAEPHLSERSIAAGRDFMAALETLGLRPEGLFWAHDQTIDEQVLVLVTAMFDHAGPLRVNEKLLRAFNLAATPREISPFIVRLHSPTEDIAAELSEFADFYRKNAIQFKVGEHGDVEGTWSLNDPTASSFGRLSIERIGIPNTDLLLYLRGFYKMDLQKKSPEQRLREWSRFSSRVDALAA